MSKRSMRDMHAVLGIVGVIRSSWEEGDGGRGEGGGEGGWRGGYIVTVVADNQKIKMIGISMNCSEGKLRTSESGKTSEDRIAGAFVAQQSAAMQSHLRVWPAISDCYGEKRATLSRANRSRTAEGAVCFLNQRVFRCCFW